MWKSNYIIPVFYEVETVYLFFLPLTVLFKKIISNPPKIIVKAKENKTLLFICLLNRKLWPISRLKYKTNLQEFSVPPELKHKLHVRLFSSLKRGFSSCSLNPLCVYEGSFSSVFKKKTFQFSQKSH